MTIDYAKQIEILGAGMTEAEKKDAVINGMQNNIGALIHLMQQQEQRISVLERTVTYLEEKAHDE